MRSLVTSVTACLVLTHALAAQSLQMNYQSLTIYVTPADLELMRQEPDGLLVTIPDSQRGKVQDVIVVFDPSGAPGTPYVRYRPNDPEFRNRPLPVLAAEFDDASLQQLRNAPLGMVFQAPAEAVSKITHVNLRQSAAARAVPPGGMAAPAQDGPTSVLDQGFPPRQSAAGSAAPPSGSGLGGWNMETAPQNQSGFNRLSPELPASQQAATAGANSGAQLWPLDTRPSAPSTEPSSFPPRPAFDRSGASAVPTAPSTFGSQYGVTDPRDAAPATGWQAPTSAPPTRRETEDRLVMNQMQTYLFDLEARLAQLTSELQWEKTRRQASEQAAAPRAAESPPAARQEVANSVPPGGVASPADGTLPRINGFLWFMLLCSIGINLYLAWISRGFYMRYAELADELRETFTSQS